MPLPPAIAEPMERIRAQILAKRPDWGDAESRIPVERYYSPEIWQAEVAGPFRQLPLIAAHSSEIAPGEVLAHDDYGVPLLLTRDAHGELRAFLNVCRHRGMRLVEAGPARPRGSMVCPYHGWTYQIDGALRHMMHREAFDACGPEATGLATLPCVERHGLVWVVPSVGGSLDLAAFLGGLEGELPFYDIANLRLFRTVRTEIPSNWKLIVDAFLEAYHIRVLHKDTISPFFTDGLTAGARHGPHISSLVARREALAWAESGQPPPSSGEDLRMLVTPSQVIFPNTITIFHPDYLSLVTLYPTAPERFLWTHRMLVPGDKTSADWSPHWEKTFNLIEQGVFQKEDIHCAIEIQRGLKTGANAHLRAGRIEQALGWFHDSVAAAAGIPL